jgi:hypothetical protein
MYAGDVQVSFSEMPISEERKKKPSNGSLLLTAKTHV